MKTICFVVPEYRRDTPTHFNHVYDLIREASTLMDMYVYVERAVGVAEFSGAKNVLIAKSKNVVLNFLESIKIFYRLRNSGVSDFYVHYSFRSAFAASLITKLFGGRVLYWNCGEPWKYKRNFLREFFERLVYTMIDYLVTGTESLKEKYAEMYRIPHEKIKVMPNWIDLKRFMVLPQEVSLLRTRLAIAPGQKVALFAHRISERKGAQYLPLILSGLKRHGVVLVVVGSGPYEKKLRDEFEKAGVDNLVRMAGAVPNERIGPYFAIADLFVMPSDEEGFPRVLLEAMSAGVPFVAFGVGGVADIVAPECREFVVAPGNTDAFVGVAEKILTFDGEKKEQMRHIEQEWVRQFSVENVARSFLQLFV